ncbi:3-deoxy-7-phosphoheptulonate synthase [bacterium]|nr:3-deoxy-7-phosphoheptulonate synthase [bacterium]
MIVTMRPGAAVSEIGAVIRTCQAQDLIAVPSHGAHRTVIGVVTADRSTDLSDVADLPGVEQVSPVSASFKLVGREFREEPTVVDAGGVRIGGEEFVVMAGPCSVETPDQIEACARQVAACGGRILRGGAYKPRTSPYSFQGLGEEGLELLARAGARHGLPTITEVMHPDLVATVAARADILQIGARNVQNYALLEAVGRARKPVMLKRGLMTTIEELLLAAEYILAGGNRQVILCERGIRTFETSTRNTLDVTAVPVIKAQSHLPVILDPSHAAGLREFVPALARAALAAGADGIMIETHPDPARALSDGRQSLDFDTFAAMMDELRPIGEAMRRPLAPAEPLEEETA